MDQRFAGDPGGDIALVRQSIEAEVGLHEEGCEHRIEADGAVEPGRVVDEVPHRDGAQLVEYGPTSRSSLVDDVDGLEQLARHPHGPGHQADDESQQD